MVTVFYTDQPVCIDFFCHTEQCRTFAGDSYSCLTVIVANHCVRILRECFLCSILGGFHPDTAKRRCGITPSNRMAEGEYSRQTLFAIVYIAMHVYIVLWDPKHNP